MTTLITSKPQPNTEVDAAALASNFIAIEAVVNGSLDASNWGNGQIFAPDKIQQGSALPGQALIWSGTAWVPAPASPAVGLAFPATPLDTQEFVLVDSLTAPTFSWMFRYTAAVTDAYKWLFVGGAIKVAANEGVYQTTSAGFVNADPAIVLPVPGYYTIGYGAEFGHAATVADPKVHYLGLHLAGGEASRVQHYVPSGAIPIWTLQWSPFATYLVTGSRAVDIRYASATGNTGQWAKRRIDILPVRVSAP